MDNNADRFIPEFKTGHGDLVQQKFRNERAGSIPRGNMQAGTRMRYEDDRGSQELKFYCGSHCKF